MSVPEITAAQFLARRGQGETLTLLDVREDWELKIASVPGIVHIPMGQVAARLAEIDRDKEVVVLCRSGRRSLDVAQYLQRQGYRVANLAGGILAWGRDVDPTLASY
jgi:rhodanese-related sulfurtransferase